MTSVIPPSLSARKAREQEKEKEKDLTQAMINKTKKIATKQHYVALSSKMTSHLQTPA